MHQECQLRVQLLGLIFPLYLKVWFQEFIIQNASNVAAVASQSAPPETHYQVDTGVPVLRINDLHQNNLDVPGPSVRCLL